MTSKYNRKDLLRVMQPSKSNKNGDEYTVKKVCERFAGQTSMQGLPYINNAKTSFGKAVWTFIYIIATGGLIFHLYYLCSVYFSYPKKTTVKLGFDTLNFPALTFCNVNPVRKSKAHLLSPELQDLLLNVNPSRIRGLFGNGTSNRKKRSVDQSGYNDDILLVRNRRFMDFLNFTDEEPVYDEEPFGEDDWESVGSRDKADSIYEKFVTLYNNEARQIRLDIGHQIKDMLVKCSYAGRTCYADNFTQTTNPYYGNCYTLQSPFFKSRRSGPNKGLELMLFMESHDYIDGITTGSGAQILIHDIKEHPRPYDQGIALPTAMENFIGLKLVRISRMGEPFGTCNESESFEETYRLKYSRLACQDVCEANHIINTCKCSDLFKEEVNLRLGRFRSVPRTCQSTTELKCLTQVGRNIEHGTIDCNCHDACSQTNYEKSVSFRQWPFNDYASLLLGMTCETRTDDACQKLTQEQINNTQIIARHFMKVNVYFEDLNYQNITETQDYADAQFISDVGGTTGLWIGLSFLSLFELAQFFRELSVVFYRRCFQDKNRVNNY